MQSIFWFSLFLLAFSPSFSATSKAGLLNWDSKESQSRFARSGAKGDFFALTNFFEAQTNKFNCGPSSGAIVLNILLLGDQSVAKPNDTDGYPIKKVFLGDKFVPTLHRFSQHNFLNERTDKIKPRPVFFGEKRNGKIEGGLTLDEFTEMIRVNGLASNRFYVESLAKQKELQEKIVASLVDDTSYVIANFDRKVIGQPGGGHISPVAAYDETSDSFLVLDVNPTVTPWFWIDAKDFFRAMHSKDGERHRGFVIVSRK